MNSVIVKPTNFAAINIECLVDTRLSWKAKGIYSFLKTFNNGIITNTKRISRCSIDGEISLLSGIEELIKLGYIIIENEQYILCDIPFEKDKNINIFEESLNKKEKTIKKRKKKETPFHPESIGGKLAQLLLNKIEIVNPQLKTPNLGKWEKHFVRMMWVDGLLSDDIKNVIHFIFKDNFWKNVIDNPYILSMKYHKIKTKMLYNYNKNNTMNSNDSVFEEAKKRGID